MLDCKQECSGNEHQSENKCNSKTLQIFLLIKISQEFSSLKTISFQHIISHLTKYSFLCDLIT